MFGFSSLRCCDCLWIDKDDKNKYGEMYCPQIRDYTDPDSHTCRYFEKNFYVMTAYCDIKGLGYDCEERTCLLNFSVEYMMNNKEGQEFLTEYEGIGPVIAARLRNDAYRMDVISELEETYIRPAIEMVHSGENDTAQKTYIEMIESLKRRYGYAPIIRDREKEKRL